MPHAILTSPDGAERQGRAGAARLLRRGLTAGRRSTSWACAYLYMAVHGVYLAAVLAVLALHERLPPSRALDRWDGLIYVRIAAHGYQNKLTFLPSGRPARMDIAFFPLYPLLMRAVSTVTRLPLEASGVLISVLAGLATAVGIAVLVEPRFGRRTALLGVVLWAVGVDAMIQSMVYVQALMAALAVWAVVALIRGRWGRAAVLVVTAGLCHATAVALVATVEAAALLALVRVARGSAPRGVRSVAGPLVAALAAPLGIVGYWAFLALRFGRLDTWFLAESAPGWNSKVDFGRYSTKLLLSQLDGADFGQGRVTTAHLIATVWLVPALIIGLFLVRDLLRERRVQWQLSLLTITALALTLGDSGPWASKPRFLIPAVGLVVLPALGLSRQSARVQALALVLVGGVSVLSSAFLTGVSPVAP